jgi:hypothetical protein
VSILSSSMGSVSFLPKELRCTKKSSRPILPSHNICPLVQLHGKVSMRFYPLQTNIKVKNIKYQLTHYESKIDGTLITLERECQIIVSDVGLTTNGSSSFASGSGISNFVLGSTHKR